MPSATYRLDYDQEKCSLEPKTRYVCERIQNPPAAPCLIISKAFLRWDDDGDGALYACSGFDGHVRRFLGMYSSCCTFLKLACTF